MLENPAEADGVQASSYEFAKMHLNRIVMKANNVRSSAILRRNLIGLNLKLSTRNELVAFSRKYLSIDEVGVQDISI